MDAGPALAGAVPALSDEVTRLKLAAAARAPNTVAAYAQAWKNFLAWCGSNHLSALPSRPDIVAGFAAELVCVHGRRPATVALHVAAITHLHRARGLDPPVDSLVHQVVVGARRIAADARGKEALTVDELRRIVAETAPTARGLRDRAILLFGFATALRRSTLSALELADVEFRPQGMAVCVRREKNNSAGTPRWIGVFSTGGAGCPVAAMRAWLEIRGSAPGPVFCSLPIHSPPAKLEGKTFARIVQRAVARIGLDPRRYGGHSLRAGFVTSAAEAGVSPLVIAQTTGHRSLATLQRYFRPATLFNVNPLAGVL